MFPQICETHFQNNNYKIIELKLMPTFSYFELIKGLFMIRKIILISALLQLSWFWVAKAEKVADENSAARVLSKQLYRNLEINNPVNIKVRKLTLHGTRLSSEFAYNLLDRIENELTREEYKKYFPSVGKLSMGKPKSIIQVLPNEDEDLDAKDAFLEGDYELGEEVLVRLRLVLNNGKSVSSGEIRIPESNVKHRIKPKNEPIVQKTLKEASLAKFPQTLDFDFKLILNKETIEEGDDLEIFFYSNTKSYLHLLYQDAEENRYIIFPFQGQQKIPFNAREAHDNITFPMEIYCGPGCGEEMIWAFASDRTINPAQGYKDNLNGSGLRGYKPYVSITSILNHHRAIEYGVKKAEKLIHLTTIPRKK